MRFGLKATLGTLSPVDSVRLAVAFFPKVALGLVITLSAGLFIAFGRGALAEHTRSLQQAWPLVATRRRELTDAAGAGFDVPRRPRRLYYGGVLLVDLITLRAGGAGHTLGSFFSPAFFSRARSS